MIESDPREAGPSPAGMKLPASVDGVLCDAATATIPLWDDGLLRGDGAFEYIRAYAGHLFTLTEHLDRLQRTCDMLRLECPRQQVESELARLMEWAGPVDADVRIVLTRGGRRLLIVEPRFTWTPARLAFVEDTPREVILGAKSLSYAGNMAARRRAQERGFTEALLVTPDGRVLEVQQAVFFWADPDGVLCTPPLSEGILDSITRRIVVRGMDVDERICRREDALAATEAFIGASAREITAVAAVEDRVFAEVPGPLTREATAVYRRAVEHETGLSPEGLWGAG